MCLKNFNTSQITQKDLNDYTMSLLIAEKKEELWACAPIGDTSKNIELEGFFTSPIRIANTLLKIGYYDITKKLFFSILYLPLTLNPFRNSE